MTQRTARDLLREVTADCHDGEEQFWSVFHALAEDGLRFPLRATALGEPVSVVDLDGSRSDLRRGIVAVVRKGDQKHPMNLADIEFVDLDPASAGLLEMYRYWLKPWGGDDEL